MNKNIKIAKKLIKIARKLIADENNIKVECNYDAEWGKQLREYYFNFYGSDKKHTLAVDKTIRDSNQVFQVKDIERLYSDDYEVKSYDALTFEKIKEIIKSKGDLDEINENCDFELDKEFSNIDDFLDCIKNFKGEKAIDLLNKEAINEIVEASKSSIDIPSFDEISKLGNYEDFGLELKSGYNVFTSMGQGNWIDVIYNTSKLNEKKINDVLWNIPVLCDVIINGTKYTIGRTYEDIYNYNKNKYLENCKTIIPDFDKYFEEVKRLLPTEPEN